MKGIILTNAFWCNDDSLYQARRLVDEFEKLDVQVEIKRNDDFDIIIDKGIKNALGNYDFCIYLDKDNYVLKGLVESGTTVFNNYESIIKCDDKVLTLIELAKEGIPVPKTIPSLLCYENKYQISDKIINKIENELGYPLVLKLNRGSLGAGVFLIEDRKQLVEYVNKYKTQPHHYQRCIKDSVGIDVRVIVVGGEVIGGMERKAKSGLVANVARGGSAKKIDLSPKLKEYAKRIAKILNLDYCGIDFLYENNSYVVIEVNSNAFFSEFEKVTGINVAQRYAQHVVKKLK